MENQYDSEIIAALAEFNQSFSEAYASAIVFTERMPEQVNNEIRNSVTHLSRAAQCVIRKTAVDIATISSELSSARRHLERAKRDCFKLAVIYINKDLQLAMRVVEDKTGGVVQSIRDSYEAANEERKGIIVAEANSTEGSQDYLRISDRYKNLTRVLKQIQNDLFKEYSVSDTYVRYYKTRRLITKTVVWFVSFVLSATVAFFVGAYSSNYAREIVEMLNSFFN